MPSCYNIVLINVMTLCHDTTLVSQAMPGWHVIVLQLSPALFSDEVTLQLLKVEYYFSIWFIWQSTALEEINSIIS